MDNGNWDDLRFVLAVAQAGSVNAAAQKLGKNHATILRRVASFERFHSIAVFQKNTKGYVVAPDAVPVIEAIRSVQTSVDAMERVIAGKGEAFKGTVRLTSTDSMSRSVLPKIIREFQKTQPNLKIELVSANAWLDLAKLDAEITIRPAKSLPAELSGTKVGVMGFEVYGSSIYLAKHTSPRIAAHNWLGVSGPLTRSPVGAWTSDIPQDNIVFSADSFVTLADAAETGLGLAMMPVCLGQHSEALVRASQFPTRLETNVWVAAHKDLYDTPRVSMLVKHFAEALRATKIG